MNKNILEKIKKYKNTLTIEQKRKLLVGLKTIRENMGIQGGVTDISNPDNLLVNENEFTNKNSTYEPKTIAKTMVTNADFDSYINQRRGIEFTPKELQAVYNYLHARPSQQDKFFVKYETTDGFGNNETTVIKKWKENNQFVWIAFTKHEAAEESNSEVEKKAEAQSQGMDSAKSSNGEMTIDDQIHISKTIPFIDDTQGANILSNFLSALDL